MELSTGYTPDISVFRFHIWEPIWYYIPKYKIPHDCFKKARWLGIAWQAGDAFTYYIETERPRSEGRPVVLIRSNIGTRRKNIGLHNEYVEENPESANFFFRDKDDNTITDQGEVDITGPLTISFDNNNEIPINEEDKNFLLTDGIDSTKFSDQATNQTGEINDADPLPSLETGETINDVVENDLYESLPESEQGLNIDPEEIAELYDQFEVEDDTNHTYHSIAEHKF